MSVYKVIIKGVTCPVKRFSWETQEGGWWREYYQSRRLWRSLRLTLHLHPQGCDRRERLQPSEEGGEVVHLWVLQEAKGQGTAGWASGSITEASLHQAENKIITFTSKNLSVQILRNFLSVNIYGLALTSKNHHHVIILCQNISKPSQSNESFLFEAEW